MHSAAFSLDVVDRPVAVVGAGLAGARCASLLREAGLAVTVVDKSRGAGGRLATRRGVWTDAAGQQHTVRWDHGAPGFETTAPDFLAWLHAQAAQGRARVVQAKVAGQGLGPARWQGWPTQPALCQSLLEGAATHWNCTVQGLTRDPEGWTLHTDGGDLGPFAAVVLALPPAQAAPLLAPHRDDWARAASLVPMQPCWTLMGVSESLAGDPHDEVWLPEMGPLERLTRQRAADLPAGATAWVAHARAAWSRQHLEDPAEQVLPDLQAAAEAALGQPVRWLHAAVHRWRYAQPALPPREDWGGARWDAALALGLCGDHLAGFGAEGAWRSGSALAQCMQAPSRHAPPPLGRADGAVVVAPARP
ncbi:NAD(P)/FAD-dependent oxidoreductase [Inhella crocodyli]|uniref:NAD/FAD-dependent oxidoreductase n=1 Tax=Inhella crocodyli TaxID=2499851 RepID=A0A437LKR7_9BURK|nr:FAD-dependent oxidoreductase [Inhella crocodyli]RVT86012.1 NAD/FAD-dependent oxidoreductase [Inhella crocodyli]